MTSATQIRVSPEEKVSVSTSREISITDGTSRTKNGPRGRQEAEETVAEEAEDASKIRTRTPTPPTPSLNETVTEETTVATITDQTSESDVEITHEAVESEVDVAEPVEVATPGLQQDPLIITITTKKKKCCILTTTK